MRGTCRRGQMAKRTRLPQLYHKLMRLADRACLSLALLFRQRVALTNNLKSTTMTRPIQKQSERDTLRTLFFVLDMPPEISCEDGEAPDFMVQIDDRTIGIEVTMYQSGQIVAATGIQKRKVESEWERFNCSSRFFREEQPDLRNICILFRFKDSVPPSKERQLFLTEILDFIRLRRSELGPQYLVFSRHQFTSPLMMKYLSDLCLCVCEHADWDSNVTAGFLGRFDENVAGIVTKKSVKLYRQATELWLVIQCSGRISETMLPINGADDFNRNVVLRTNLHTGPFSKVYISTAMGWFQWDKVGEWQKI